MLPPGVDLKVPEVGEKNIVRVTDIEQEALK